MTDINLLLVGRTGNGKSSTGNSILGRRDFTPRSVSALVVYEIKKGTTTFGDRTVTVVDGPGLGDTDTDETEDGQSMIELTQNALSLISNKLDVLVLVLKYGMRFTNQERNALKMIEAILGDDVLRKQGVVLLSHGDSFDLDMQDETISFEDWCAQQTGDINILFKQCRQRFVLFNNRSTDAAVLKKQNEQLMKMVTDVTMNAQPYSEIDFKNAEGSRKKLLVKGKLPELHSTTGRIITKLTKQMGQISKENSLDHAANIQELNMLSAKLEEHVQFLDEEDQNTGSIEDLLITVSVTKSRLKTMTELQALKLKKAESQEALASSETSETPPREGQQRFVHRLIGVAGFAFRGAVFAFRGCFESAKIALRICIERARSFPLCRRNMFCYAASLSLFSLVFYHIYNKKGAGNLPLKSQDPGTIVLKEKIV